MKRYESSTPRVALGLAAVALSALTIGIGVALPITMGPSGRLQEIASAPSITESVARAISAPAELRHIEPIEVVAVRTPNLTSAREARPAKCKEQG